MRRRYGRQRRGSAGRDDRSDRRTARRARRPPTPRPAHRAASPRTAAIASARSAISTPCAATRAPKRSPVHRRGRSAARRWSVESPTDESRGRGRIEHASTACRVGRGGPAQHEAVVERGRRSASARIRAPRRYRRPGSDGSADHPKPAEGLGRGEVDADGRAVDQRSPAAARSHRDEQPRRGADGRARHERHAARDFVALDARQVERHAARVRRRSRPPPRGPGPPGCAPTDHQARAASSGHGRPNRRAANRSPPRPDPGP